MIPPGGTIGILGGGQLGRMLAQSARQLGYGVVVLAPAGDAPAAGLADRTIRASFEDTDAARALADACDVVTYEFENVPEATARLIAGRVPVRPDAFLLGITQDRLREHAFVEAAGIPVAPGVPVRTAADLRAGVAALGLPARLKSARGGYDGGGQWRITGPDAPADVPFDGREYRLEGEVAFDREISVVLARGIDGGIEVFPLFENVHASGILRRTTTPAAVSPTVARRAIEAARTLAEAANVVGTLTVELFVVGEDVLVNELAPRVHNSGHLTIEACAVSQFEQHIRAICGLPLAAATLRSPAAMVNLLGVAERKQVRVQGCETALKLPDVHLHWYGKGQSRPRRKMGHVTALADSVEMAVERAEAAGAALSW
jgi:5-(carboxyamino)imidazole ribonucleotide synthase